jgi:hypothetical protein
MPLCADSLAFTKIGHIFTPLKSQRGWPVHSHPLGLFLQGQDYGDASEALAWATTFKGIKKTLSNQDK